jgi:general secretion pathway protein D
MQQLFPALLPQRQFLRGWLLALLLLLPPPNVGAAQEFIFAFQNADIPTVLKLASELTGTTFLYDPEQVKGRISILAPQKVSVAGVLELLRSALALQGYTMVPKETGLWIVPTEPAAQEPSIIEVVPLQYARAEEVAATLAGVSPPGVRIIPYPPTNSVIISGAPDAVRGLVGVLKETGRGDQGR